MTNKNTTTTKAKTKTTKATTAAVRQWQFYRVGGTLEIKVYTPPRGECRWCSSQDPWHEEDCPVNPLNPLI